jgi:hypothetical protein
VKAEGRSPLERPKQRWENNIKMNLRVVEWEHGLDGYGLGLRKVAGSCECGNELSGSTKYRDFLE